jgi:hypothetical protein
MIVREVLTWTLTEVSVIRLNGAIVGVLRITATQTNCDAQQARENEQHAAH